MVEKKDPTEIAYGFLDFPKDKSRTASAMRPSKGCGTGPLGRSVGKHQRLKQTRLQQIGQIMGWAGEITSHREVLISAELYDVCFWNYSCEGFVRSNSSSTDKMMLLEDDGLWIADNSSRLFRSQNTTWINNCWDPRY